MIGLRGIVIGVLLAVIAPTAQADWPFWAKDGIRRGSKEYYEMKAADPPGARQHYKAGKLWPPVPRPTGAPQTFIHKYHHAHYWPLPYSCQDRDATTEIMNTQVNNGWLEATTMFDYHFDASTGALNSYGQQHLAWIVNNVPVEYRQVHLAANIDPGVDADRTRSIEQYISRLPGTTENTLLVQTRIATPRGRPGADVQHIFSSARENMPAPIVPIQLTGGSDSQQSN